MRSLDLPRNSCILVLSCAYSAIKTAVGRAAAAAQATVAELHMDAEVLKSEETLAQRLAQALQSAQGGVKAVVLDHVLSFPPLVLPVQKLTSICHEVRSCCCLCALQVVKAIELK